MSVEKQEPLCELPDHDIHNEQCGRTPAPEGVLIHEPTRIIADEDKPKLTKAEIKRLRRQFVTVNLPRVASCGHRYRADRQPRHRNCEECWMAWLNAHGELVQTTDELHNTEGGVAMIIQLQGTKFLKMFRRFMSTVAGMKKAQETQEVPLQ